MVTRVLTIMFVLFVISLLYNTLKILIPLIIVIVLLLIIYKVVCYEERNNENNKQTYK